MSDANLPLQSIDDCVNYFYSGETPEQDWVIGTEHEKIALYEDTLERVPYEGERGIATLLETIAKQGDWDPILESNKIIGLKRNGASITLEPGGQFELSGAPLATIKETCAEFNSHVDQVKSISRDLGIVWLSLGVDPLHAVSDVPVMPKSRYQIMRDYLPTRGGLGLEMMHLSATVQANFDFSDEADIAAKLRTAMGCTPLVSALFANSPLSAGTENGFVTKRLAIWQDTDPDRCGLLPFVFESGFGYARYAEWALDVPMFFLIREGRYIPARGLDFRTFMEKGLEGHRAQLSDWDMHLTTLFPEVRLKQIIEVRGADAVPRELTCALPAIWKGILYDAEALAEAWDLVSSFTFEERVEAQAERLVVVVRRLQRQDRRLEVRVVALAELVARVQDERVLAPALDALERLQLLRRRAAADRVGVGERRDQRAVEGVAVHLRRPVRLALGGRHRRR